MIKNESVRKHIANSAIGVVFLIAVMTFVASFFQLSRVHEIIFEHIEISRFMQRILSVFFIFIAWQLYMRKRLAWTLSIALLSVSLFLHFFLNHQAIGIIIIVCCFYALAALLVCHGDFRRPSDRLSLQRAIVFALVAFFAIIINAVIGRSVLSLDSAEPLSFWDSFIYTIQVIFGEAGDFPAYDWYVVSFVWFCFALFVVLVLHTAITDKSVSAEDKARVRELVLKYGQNQSSYLALEDDKTLFFGNEVDGVVAYGVVGNVVTVCGDPICAPEVFVRFLSEFKAFCAENSYECIFLGTSDAFLKEYELLGYSHVKAGEEAKFQLSEYQLAGGKMQKLRSLINHANKEVTTHEYKPNEEYDAEIEKGIDEVSEAWLEGKKSGQLGFSVGGVGLEDPLDRRYFYATNEEGKIVAFNVFLPYLNMNGYMADVTRRIPHAPGGVTEKLIFDGFMAFKEEGVEWGSMGLAPLANVHEEGVEDDMTVKLIEFIYEKCNRFYGFKDLHKAKEKYSPTIWAPGYFVYSSKNITPEIAYASVKIQNPGGIEDFLLSGVKARFKK